MKKQIIQTLMVVVVLILSLATAQAARLPIVGEDSNAWGTILNEYLLVSHAENGVLKNFYLNGSNITFEGTTNDDFQLILEIGNPTSDIVVTFPNNGGEITLLGQTIESDEITNDTIATADIANNAVTASKIAANAVGASEIGSGVVSSDEIADGTIATADIADNAVKQSKLNLTDITLSDFTNDAGFLTVVGNINIAIGTIKAEKLNLSDIKLSTFTNDFGYSTATNDTIQLPSQEKVTGLKSADSPKFSAINVTDVMILTGAGSPEGATTAVVGSVFLQTNGSFYVKESGAGNTGWRTFGR